MASVFDIDMADDSVVSNVIFNNNNKNDKVRGCSLVPSAVGSRSLLSSFSDKSEEDYLTRVQRESDNMDQDNPVASSNSIQLKYATPQGQKPSASKASDIPSNTRKKHEQNVVLTLNNNTVANNEDVINIQLNYNINQALDQDLWDGKFRVISLHGLMEHLASNIKNIKESLQRMQKCIFSKAIEGSMANDIKNLKGVGKVAWEFILALYNSHWDNLMVDGTNRSFRNNVKSKFSPQVIKEATKSKDSNIVNSSYMSSLLPPILAKSAKKINEISKYFKKQSTNIT